MPLRIKSADFICAALNKNLPDLNLPEVAVIGRSNAGKSTLVNRLTQRRRLARTSSTPGRTQEFNFFRVALKHDDDSQSELLLADLPGYGFARYSKAKREKLAGLTLNYLSQRESLRVICLLNDCRRDPEGDELVIRDLAFEHEKHLLVVVTKMDKLKSSERQKRLNAIASGYGLQSADLVPSGNDIPADELWARIGVLLD
jgi:GTP-binding protein